MITKTPEDPARGLEWLAAPQQELAYREGIKGLAGVFVPREVLSASGAEHGASGAEHGASGARQNASGARQNASGANQNASGARQSAREKRLIWGTSIVRQSNKPAERNALSKAGQFI